MTPFFRRLKQRRAARRRVERVFHRSARDREAGYTVAADYWQAKARHLHAEFQREYPEVRPGYIRTLPPRPSRWWWRATFALIPVALIAVQYSADTGTRAVMACLHVGCLLRAVRLDSKPK